MRKVKSAVNQPLTNRYCTELYQRNELILEIPYRYPLSIGIFFWALELVHIDILTEVKVMSQYLAPPLLVHLEFLYHIFEYLRKNEMSRVVFDPFQSKVYENEFASGTMDWK